MSESSSKRDPLAPARGGRPLVDRVRDRVQASARALERTDGARQPRIRPGRRPRAEGGPSEVDREARALRSVFTDLGSVYRQYRRRTGAAISPAIRTAAIAFKADQTLLALVPVAGLLDDLELLDW